MNVVNRIELAIRRAASQMPNHQSRAFRLVADELQAMPENEKDAFLEEEALASWRALEKGD